MIRTFVEAVNCGVNFCSQEAICKHPVKPSNRSQAYLHIKQNRLPQPKPLLCIIARDEYLKIRAVALLISKASKVHVVVSIVLKVREHQQLVVVG